MSDHKAINTIIDRIMDMRNESKHSQIELVKSRAYAEGYGEGFDEGYKVGCDACLAELMKHLIKEREVE